MLKPWEALVSISLISWMASQLTMTMDKSRKLTTKTQEPMINSDLIINYTNYLL